MTISDETKDKLQVLKQNHNDIASQYSNDIGQTHLEEKVKETDPKLPPVASKLYPLPSKYQKFIKEEIENLLQSGLIKRSVSPYTAPIIVFPRKRKPGTPLAETKRLVIDYTECRFLILFDII